MEAILADSTKTENFYSVQNPDTESDKQQPMYQSDLLNQTEAKPVDTVETVVIPVIEPKPIEKTKSYFSKDKFVMCMMSGLMAYTASSLFHHKDTDVTKHINRSLAYYFSALGVSVALPESCGPLVQGIIVGGFQLAFATRWVMSFF